MPIKVTLSDAAFCLTSLDDRQFRRECGLPEPKRNTFDLTPTEARKLRSLFETRQGPGWDNDNPGAATRTARAAVKRIDSALAKCGER